MAITKIGTDALDDGAITTAKLASAVGTDILASPVITGNLTTDGTIDGRDIDTDGTKLDGVEASADVTDTTNVTAAGALMDSELTAIASVKALNQGVATGDSPTFAAITATTYTGLPTSGLTLTAVKTANYTATEGSLVLMSTTAAARTLTLPATPDVGDKVGWIDYDGTFATNNLTVARNGKNIMGLAENMTVSTNNANATLIYIDATKGWML